MKPSTVQRGLAATKAVREGFSNTKPSLEAPKLPKPRVKITGQLPGYYLNQAEQAIRDHPATPAAWKRNIRPFLLNCLKEIPYVASWHWAIHSLKTFCKYAPFKYFREVLRNPNKFKLGGTTTKFREVEMSKWLEQTKGLKIARAYLKRATIASLASLPKKVTITDHHGKDRPLDVSNITPNRIMRELDPERHRALEALWKLRNGVPLEQAMPVRPPTKGDQRWAVTALHIEAARILRPTSK